MNWTPIVIELSAFAAATSVGLLIARLIFKGDERVDERLDDLSREGAAGTDSSGTRGSRFSSQFERTLPKVASRLIPNDQRERNQLQARLVHAGIYAPWALPVYLVARICVMAIPPVLGFVAEQLQLVESPRGVLLGALCGAFGTIVPSLWLDRKKSQRHLILSQSLPDFLDLIITCIESGLSLEAALRRVNEELQLAHPVLAGEMAVVQRQIDLGATADSALRDLAKRSDFEPLFSMSSLLEHARKFGTGISEALRTHAEMLRTQREQRAEELAEKAAVKIIFPTLVFILPTVFVVLAGPAAIQLNEKFSKSAEQSAQQDP